VTAAADPTLLDPLTLADAAIALVLAGSWRHPVVFTHALTAPLALHQLTPVLGAPAVAAGSQALFKVIAAFATVFPATDTHYDGPTWSAEQLLERAIGTGDEHAIKAAVACIELSSSLGDRRALTAGAALVTALA
jgi:putative Ca2+/H+ antiporter (TMEM165/GDT1 family)